MASRPLSLWVLLNGESLYYKNEKPILTVDYRALFLFTNVFAIMDIVNSKRNTRDREARHSAAQSQATSVAASEAASEHHPEVSEVNGPEHV